MARYIDADKIFYRERMTVWYNSKPIKEDIAFKQDIENVQTEDVAPVVHAHKVRAHSRGGGTHWVVCSHCELPIDWQDAYCKHCGAPMDEVAIDET